jgi:hypothetical protein
MLFATCVLCVCVYENNTCTHILGGEVLPDRAWHLPTCCHLLIVNKNCLLRQLHC